MMRTDFNFSSKLKSDTLKLEISQSKELNRMIFTRFFSDMILITLNAYHHYWDIFVTLPGLDHVRGKTFCIESFE